MKEEENRKTEGENQWTISEDKIQTHETQKYTTINKDWQSTKIANTHEQRELPMNQEWTQVLRNRKLFMPIAIHPTVNGIVHGQVPYDSNPVMGEKESTTTSDHLPSG